MQLVDIRGKGVKVTRPVLAVRRIQLSREVFEGEKQTEQRLVFGRLIDDDAFARPVARVHALASSVEDVKGEEFHDVASTTKRRARRAMTSERSLVPPASPARGPMGGATRARLCVRRPSDD